MLPRSWFALGHGVAGAFLWWYLPDLWDKVQSDKAPIYVTPPAFLLPLTLLTHYGFNSYILLVASSTCFTFNQGMVLITQLMYGSYLRQLDLLNLPGVEIVSELLATTVYITILWNEVYTQRSQHYMEPVYPHGVAEYRLEKKMPASSSSPSSCGDRGRVNYMNCSYFAVDTEEEKV